MLSETEAWYSRSDLIIKDLAKKRCLILKLKHVTEESEPAEAINKTSNQMIKMKYESSLCYVRI